MKLCLIETPDPLRDITKHITQYLWQHEHMETDRLLLPNGEYVIQGQVCSNKIKKYFGLDKRIMVTFRTEGKHRYSVWVDHPSLKDKLSMMSVSFICLWPLFFTTLYGLLDQYALWGRLQHFLRTIC